MTDQHLDLDVLADVLAGEADAASAGHARACPACAADLVALEAADAPVTAALSGLPSPDLPDGLAERLEQAVARERRTGAGSGSAATVVPLAGRRHRWVPWAGGVAAAAVLVTGGLLLRHGGGPSDSTSSGAAPAAGRAEAAVPTSATGTDYAAPVKAGGPAGAAAATGRLAAALPALLRGGASSPAAEPLTARAVSPPLTEPAALQACLAGLQDPDHPAPPLALDRARYAGAPALVAVYPSSAAGKVDVYVVGAGCSSSDQQLLLFARVSAP